MTKLKKQIANSAVLILIISLALLRCGFEDPLNNFKVIMDLEFEKEVYSGNVEAGPTTNIVIQNQKLTGTRLGNALAKQKVGFRGTAGITEEKQYDVELFYGWEGTVALTITNDSPTNTAEITFQIKGKLVADENDSVYVNYTPSLMFGVSGAADATQQWQKTLGDMYLDAYDLVKNRVDGKNSITNYTWFLVIIVVSDWIDMTVDEVKLIFPGSKTIDGIIDPDDFRDYTLNELKSSTFQAAIINNSTNDVNPNRLAYLKVMFRFHDESVYSQVATAWHPDITVGDNTDPGIVLTLDDAGKLDQGIDNLFAGHQVFVRIIATAFTFWNVTVDPEFPVSMGDEQLNLTIQSLKMIARAEVATE